MADFDSVSKRYSGIGLGLDFMRVRPVPDASIDSADILHFLPLYSGIAASEPPVSDSDVRRKMRAGQPIWRRWKLLFKQGA